MTAIKKTGADMMWIEDKGFVIFWYVRLLILGTQGIEKAVEFAVAYEADITDLHRRVWFPWMWVP